MHAPSINTLLVAAVLGLSLSLSGAPAAAQSKAGIQAMPMQIPTHNTAPGNAAGVPNTPAAAPAAGPQNTRPQAEKIAFDASDMQGAKHLSLSAIWVRAAPVNAQVRKPTVLAMHSCGGLYSIIRSDKSILTPRTVSMARELRNAGYNVLFPDSLSSRGRSSICTESLQQRIGSTAEQARDVQAALRWLAKQDDVDPDRIALLGWAHGGTAVMQALTLAPARDLPKIKVAIAFYPDCAQFNPKVAYKPVAPLLMLTGEEDDWAPAASCAALTDKAAPQMLKLNTYPDSYHEFDAPGMPLQVRLDVPNPLHPGQGVTSATNPDAKIAAYKDMFEFLAAALH